MCSHVIANIGRLVLKSARPGHRGIKGWELSIDQRAELSARIAAEPWAWSGQEPVRASTTPTTENTSLTAAPTVLRLFGAARSEEHTSELQSRGHRVCRLLLEK